jgi:hypothetical protein
MILLLQHPVALISIISSTYISVTMQHTTPTVTLASIRNMFRPLHCDGNTDEVIKVAHLACEP